MNNNNAAQRWQPRSVDEKIAIAERFETYLRDLAQKDPNEDLFCLLSVVTDYAIELRNARDRKKIDERRFYAVRISSMLAAILLTELHEDYRQELSEWYYGAEEGDSFLYLVANTLTDALQQFAQAMESGRKRNYKPLTEEETEAIAKIINREIPLDDPAPNEI